MEKKERKEKRKILIEFDFLLHCGGAVYSSYGKMINCNEVENERWMCKNELIRPDKIEPR